MVPRLKLPHSYCTEVKMWPLCPGVITHSRDTAIERNGSEKFLSPIHTRDSCSRSVPYVVVGVLVTLVGS